MRLGFVSQPDGGLVLGLRCWRAPAPGDGGRPRRAAAPPAVARGPRRGPVGRPQHRDAVRPHLARLRGLRPGAGRSRRHVRPPRAAGRRPGGVRARPRVGDRRRRLRVPAGHHPLRGALPGPRRGAGGRRAHRARRHRRARPLVGHAGLVDPRVDMVRRLARRRHPLPRHHRAAGRRRGAVSPRLRPAAGRTAGGRRAHRGDLGAWRPRVPDVRHRRLRRPPPRRGAGGVRPGPPRGRRRQGVALPAGAVPVPRRRHRPDRAPAGSSGTSRNSAPPGRYR